MSKVSQEVAVILPILPLLLEGRLEMKVFRYFRSSYIIGTVEYQWDSTFDKVIHTNADNYLEEIDRYWIQYTDDFTMRNIYYKDEDREGCATIVGSFDMTGTLGRPRIMEDNNEPLPTMELNKGLNEDDSYIDIEIKNGKFPATEGTEVSPLPQKLSH